jgi:hypothetical protein
MRAQPDTHVAMTLTSRTHQQHTERHCETCVMSLGIRHACVAIK